MPAKREPFAVFILRDTEWQFWCGFGGIIQARAERDYLINGLGLTAQVFQRKLIK